VGDDPRPEERDGEYGPAERIREILRECGREEVEGDRRAGRELIGDLDVQQQEEQNHREARQHRRDTWQRRPQAIISLEQYATSDE